MPIEYDRKLSSTGSPAAAGTEVLTASTGAVEVLAASAKPAAIRVVFQIRRSMVGKYSH
jgi:hypothetical protein